MVLSAALIIITLLVYWQVTSHEFISYDDNVYVTENSHIEEGITLSNIVWAFRSVYAANWHPVTWLSHIVDIEIHGMRPYGHHLTNILIHALSTVLLFLFFFRLSNHVWQSSFVAALFALHPLHVESVAWVAERKDVLSAFFCFAALLLYAEFMFSRKRSHYLLSITFFVVGLMSKPMLVTLPVVLLVMDFWPLNGFSSGAEEAGQRRLPAVLPQLAARLKATIPFVICSLMSVAITIYAQHKGGAISGIQQIPFWYRLENAATAYVRYLFKAFWPHDLAILYPFPALIPLWQVICSLVILGLVSVVTIRAGRRYPYLPLGWFWFLITLLPVIGIIQVGVQSMADRYSYIPLTGFSSSLPGAPRI